MPFVYGDDEAAEFLDILKEAQSRVNDLYLVFKLPCPHCGQPYIPLDHAAIECFQAYASECYNEYTSFLKRKYPEKYEKTQETVPGQK